MKLTDQTINDMRSFSDKRTDEVNEICKRSGAGLGNLLAFIADMRPEEQNPFIEQLKAYYGTNRPDQS